MEKREFVMPEKVECDKESLTDSYGKFIIQPLERGYGLTLGNALRRVLISSLEGAAVNRIKIEGVFHEFSTIPGVLEDVPQIILNLKKMVLRLHSSEPKTVRIEAKKKGEIRAKDIIKDESVEILNPDLYIATVSSEKGKLIMEIEVCSGRGYLPAEMKKEKEKPIGVIDVDSVFTPVRKVNYQVENTRVKQMTNYDRLILEIWTNRAISPEKALIEGARILQRHLEIFVNYGEEKGEEKKEEKEKGLEEQLNRPITDIELSVRSARCLEAANINTIGDLVTKTEEEMLEYKNFGKRSLSEIKEALGKMGLSLGMKKEDKSLKNK
ncbi:MAG: DNA-directed RNA polymerase subunit alpha [Candidatus Omnitrophota bacterium]|nr:MAG: DNA-directed RNA polymerase subunit alpha [Candidatus Omnitrophota bacterium]